MAHAAIEEVVGTFSEPSGEFEVIVAKKSDVDDITLRVEWVLEAVGQRQEVEGRHADQLRLGTNLRSNLVFHENGTLPRYQAKARRFKDLRKAH